MTFQKHQRVPNQTNTSEEIIVIQPATVMCTPKGVCDAELRVEAVLVYTVAPART